MLVGWAALGDPTRRTSFARLASAPRAVGELADTLPVSTPAVSQHPKSLKTAGLVIGEAAAGSKQPVSVRVTIVGPRGSPPGVAFTHFEYDPDSSLPPERRFRLVVTATDVTRGELVYFPWDYERTYGLEPGRQLVVDAVRASMSIPFFYEPATLEGSDETSSTLVDGGVLSNFPIDIFDRTDGRPPRWPTFGVKLLPLLPMDAAKLLPIAGPFKHGPVALAANLAMTTIVGRDQAHLAKPWVKIRTMQVDTAGLNPVDFGLSRTQATALFENGQAAATRFLTGWDWEHYLATFREVTRLDA